MGGCAQLLGRTFNYEMLKAEAPANGGASQGIPVFKKLCLLPALPVDPIQYYSIALFMLH